MCRIVSFVSGTGGAGQTSIIFKLSQLLSQKRYKVCVFDAHFNMNNLSLKYNYENSVDLKDYLVDDISHLEVQCSVNMYLKVIKTNCITFNYLSHYETIKYFISKISEDFDYILIDVPLLDNKLLSLALESSNEAMLIATDDPYSIRSAAKVLQKLHFYKNILSISLVINKLRVIAEITGKALGENEICEILKMDPLFVFPKFYKHNIFNMQNLDSKQAKILEEFINSFISLNRCQSDYKKQYSGVVGLVRRKLYAKYE